MPQRQVDMEIQRTPTSFNSTEHLKGSFDSRGRSSIDRKILRPSAIGTEATSTPMLPRTLSSMLKTTTETGDIGQFSIKSVQRTVPFPGASPSHAQDRAINEFKHRKHYTSRTQIQRTVIDDRRGLPSYTDDFLDRPGHLNSQSRRGLERSEQRSYSLTQASYSPYALPTRRSNVSPKSQLERLNSLQRPRSPFAYPTRLKRPGFRPSSPALTDGGAVDYSRRIGRAQYDYNPPRPTPSALYARRRRPPQGSSYSPISFEKAPFIVVDRGIQKWAHSSSAVSERLSPAYSTTSLLSNTNSFRQEPPRSAAASSGRSLPPPSPRYYDYTEEFHVDELYIQPATIASSTPPPFPLSKSIPEDRELSSEWSSLIASQESFGYSNPSHSTFPTSSESSAKLHHSGSSFDVLEERDSTSKEDRSGVVTSSVAPLSADIERNAVTSNVDMEIVRVRDGTRNTIDRSTERIVTKGSTSGTVKSNKKGAIEPSRVFHADEGDGRLRNIQVAELDDTSFVSNRSSHYTLSTQLPIFPNPPERRNSGHYSYPELVPNEHQPLVVEPEEISTLVLEDADRSLTSDMENVPSTNLPSMKLLSEPQHNLSTSLDEALEPVLGTGYHIDPVKYQSLALTQSSLEDTNVSDAVPNFNVLEHEQHGHQLNVLTTQAVFDASLPKASNEFLTLRVVSASPIAKIPVTVPSASINTCNSDSDPINKLVGKEGGSSCIKSSSDSFQKPSNIKDETHITLPNVTYQIPQEALSHPCTPILAPTAISPVRMKKLTNSVPQLMKALPPLPGHSSIETCTDRHFAAWPRIEESHFKESLLLQHPTSPIEALHNGSDARAAGLIELDSNPVIPLRLNQPNSGIQPQRFKLKTKFPKSLHSPSSLTARPWNSDESYPWMEDELNVRLPSIISDRRSNVQNVPKFKLKVTRASMTSLGSDTVGTVKINRRGDRSGMFDRMDMQHPKDLFSPSPGIGGVIRYVSRHLSSHRSSPQDNHVPPDIPRLRLPTAGSNIQGKQVRAASFDVGSSQILSDGSDPISPIQSFFSDDSSQVRIQNGLRQKINNLRARLPVPYATRSPATQSHDDIIWRTHHQQPIPVGTKAREVQAPTHISHTSGDDKKATAGVRRRRIKNKVSEWCKEARVAIKGYAKKKRESG